MTRHLDKLLSRDAARRYRALLGAAALGLVCAAPRVSAEPPADEIARLREENRALRQETADLRARVGALTAELETLRKGRADLAARNQALEEQTQTLQTLAGVATDQDIQAQHRARIRQTRDDQAQDTAVSFGPEPLEIEGTSGDVYFSVSFTQAPGEPPPHFVLTLQALRTGRHFEGRETVEFVVDGQALALAPESYRFTSRRSGRKRLDISDEVVAFRLDRSVFERLASAQELVVRSGRLEASFDRDDRAALRAVRDRVSTPATPQASE